MATAISEPTPLAVVYMLAPTTEAVSPGIVDLSPVEAVLALQGALYQPDLMTPRRAASALTTVADLAGRVRVRQLTLRRGYEWLAAVLADVVAIDGVAP